MVPSSLRSLSTHSLTHRSLDLGKVGQVNKQIIKRVFCVLCRSSEFLSIKQVSILLVISINPQLQSRKLTSQQQAGQPPLLLRRCEL